MVGLKRPGLGSMTMKWTITLLAAVLATGAGAQDNPVADYMNACASCHGPDGTGSGPMARLLTVEVPDLTGLAARHDGVFPYDRVVQTISGQYGLRGHGDAMPVWGDRFKDEAGGDAYGAEGAAMRRIEALADYLEVLQAE